MRISRRLNCLLTSCPIPLLGQARSLDPLVECASPDQDDAGAVALRDKAILEKPIERPILINVDQTASAGSVPLVEIFFGSMVQREGIRSSTPGLLSREREGGREGERERGMEGEKERESDRHRETGRERVRE